MPLQSDKMYKFQSDSWLLRWGYLNEICDVLPPRGEMSLNFAEWPCIDIACVPIWLWWSHLLERWFILNRLNLHPDISWGYFKLCPKIGEDYIKFSGEYLWKNTVMDNGKNIKQRQRCLQVATTTLTYSVCPFCSSIFHHISVYSVNTLLMCPIENRTTNRKQIAKNAVVFQVVLRLCWYHKEAKVSFGLCQRVKFDQVWFAKIFTCWVMFTNLWFACTSERCQCLQSGPDNCAIAPPCVCKQ